MTFPVYRFDPGSKTQNFPLDPIDRISKTEAQNLYRLTVRLRRIEEALIQEYRPAEEMRCPIHFCIGQEASSAALSALMEPKDVMYSHHRSHGFYFGKNAPIRPFFAELYGKATGANGGLAGSQDISHHESNFHSGAILSGGVAIATGAALAIKQRKQKQCVVTGFGDGATDEGAFWEALNFSVLRNLPLVFFCENNRYATYSPQEKRNGEISVAKRVHGFGIPTSVIFGNDVVRVYCELKNSVEKARRGEGCSFIESYTYRWCAHVGPGDDNAKNHYRPVEEIAFWKEWCPIILLERRMRDAEWLTDADKTDAYKAADAEIADAFQFAKSSPFPSNINFAEKNLSKGGGLAEKLLEDIERSELNPFQAETLPEPY